MRLVAAGSRYQYTIPFPPLTIGSREVRSNVAISSLSSQISMVVGVPMGDWRTVSSTGTGSERQVPLSTTAYTVLVPVP